MPSCQPRRGDVDDGNVAPAGLVRLFVVRAIHGFETRGYLPVPLRRRDEVARFKSEQQFIVDTLKFRLEQNFQLHAVDQRGALVKKN